MAISDDLQLLPGYAAPIIGGFSVTPSDSVDIKRLSRFIWVGGTGDLKVDLANGETVTLKAVPVGMLALRCKRVHSTGTTASEILALD